MSNDSWLSYMNDTIQEDPRAGSSIIIKHPRDVAIIYRMTELIDNEDNGANANPFLMPQQRYLYTKLDTNLKVVRDEENNPITFEDEDIRDSRGYIEVQEQRGGKKSRRRNARRRNKKSRKSRKSRKGKTRRRK
jgi:low affinity Fe/Cu permease